MPVNIRSFDHTDLKAWLALVLRYAEETDWRAEECRRLALLGIKRPGAEPERNLLLAEEAAGRLVGFGGILVEAAISRAIVFVFVHRSRRRQGIGSRLFDCLLERAAEAGCASYQLPISDEDETARRFLASRDFRRVRLHLEMESTSLRIGDSGSVGDGIVLDHFSFGEEEALARLQNRVFSGNWGFCPNQKREIEHFLKLTRCGMEDVICFRRNSRTVGYLWPGFPEDRGSYVLRQPVRIHMWGLLPEFRGRGWSRPLLNLGLADLISRGASGFRLMVDAANTPAVALYRKMGFRTKSTWIWYSRSRNSSSA